LSDEGKRIKGKGWQFVEFIVFVEFVEFVELKREKGRNVVIFLSFFSSSLLSFSASRPPSFPATLPQT